MRGRAAQIQSTKVLLPGDLLGARHRCHRNMGGLNDRTSATELNLREHAAEIEEFSRSNERYLEV